MCVEKVTGKIESDFLKIGNYAITFFATVVTGSLALGNITAGPENYPVAIPFALYTILSAFIAYCHRLAWLRTRKGQEIRGEPQTNLPNWAVIMFLLVHLLLIALLGYYLYHINGLPYH